MLQLCMTKHGDGTLDWQKSWWIGYSSTSRL